ncbi:MAG: antibiotic biosynthesis monooxygenase family protein [Dehalococcoidia bacterium]
MYCIGASYLVQAGNEEVVVAQLRECQRLSRQEPGCLQYVVHRSTEDPRRIFIYEQYRDEAAFQAHVKSAHVQRIVFGLVLPLLESRVRETYEPIAE